MGRRYWWQLKAGLAASSVLAAVLGLSGVAHAAGSEPAGEKADKLPASPQSQNGQNYPKSTGRKADQLPVPPVARPEKDYPVTAGRKEDRGPVPPQTTKQKPILKSADRLSADDRLEPGTPDPDRLAPEQP